MQSFKRWRRLLALLLATSLLGLAQSHAQRRQSAAEVPAEAVLIYQLVGVADYLTQVASVAHCTNLSQYPTRLWFEVRDDDPSTDQLVDAWVLPGHSVTFGTQETGFYYVSAATAGSVRQGWAGIYSEDERAWVICTAQLIDPSSSTPSYIAQLQLFSPGGQPVTTLTYRALLPLLKR